MWLDATGAMADAFLRDKPEQQSQAVGAAEAKRVLALNWL
jgi:hypothetical protein